MRIEDGMFVSLWDNFAIQDAIEDSLMKAVNTLKIQCQRNTGRSEKSIRAYTQFDETHITSMIKCDDSVRYAVNGRGAGKMPPEEPIRDWLASKGWRGTDGTTLDKEWQRKSATYALRKSIADNGTQRYRQLMGRDVFGDTLRQARQEIVDVLSTFDPNLYVINNLKITTIDSKY